MDYMVNIKKSVCLRIELNLQNEKAKDEDYNTMKTHCTYHSISTSAALGRDRAPTSVGRERLYGSWLE